MAPMAATHHDQGGKSRLLLFALHEFSEPVERYVLEEASSDHGLDVSHGSRTIRGRNAKIDKDAIDKRRPYAACRHVSAHSGSGCDGKPDKNVSAANLSTTCKEGKKKASAKKASRWQSHHAGILITNS